MDLNGFFRYFSNPFRMSLLILLITVFLNIVLKMIFYDVKVRYFTLFSLSVSSYIVGFFYAKYGGKTPGRGFRKVMALYYILFSRLAFIILALIFFEELYDISLDFLGIAPLLLYSLFSLIVSYYLISYMFNLGFSRSYLRYRDD